MNLRSILTAATLGMAGFVIATLPTVALGQTKPVEKKCDATGKECTKGKDCKVENCKPAQPKADAPVVAPEKKCDPKGKECKEGKDCKVENCKPAPKK